jgi:hypothetical protein
MDYSLGNGSLCRGYVMGGCPILFSFSCGLQLTKSLMIHLDMMLRMSTWLIYYTSSIARGG